MVKKFFDAPILNTFGLQIAYVLAARALLWTRRLIQPAKKSSSLTALQSEGYVTFENCLPEDIYNEIKSEFSRSIENPELIGDTYVDSIGMKETSVFIKADNQGAFPKTLECIKEDDRFCSLIGAYLGYSPEKIRDGLRIAFWRNELCADGDPAQKQITYSNCDLHADTPYSIVKGFLYLSDISPENAPHRYIRKSNRLSLRRLWFEYVNSTARKESGPRLRPGDLPDRALEEIVFTGPENTLIIEDTFGFHGATKPAPGHHRDLLFFQYRARPFEIRS